MDLIKDVKFLLVVIVFLVSTLSCSAAIVVPEKTKTDRSSASSGLAQYMGYPGQGYGIGYGGGEYPGAAYPPAPIPGLVPPYANGGGYLGGFGPSYNGYYPPYGEFIRPPYPIVPPIAPPVYPPIVPPVYPPVAAVPYPGYYPGIMRPGMGYNPYSAKKEKTDARA